MEKKKSTAVGIGLAILAAVLYAINAPLSKLLLAYMPATLMAGFLYLGAGLGMAFVALVRQACGDQKREEKLTKKELPYTIAMIALDIAAPVCLLLGLKDTAAENAALLNNFEIVATALIAWIVFKEQISKRLWAGIAFVTAACLVLSFEASGSLQFSYGSLLVLLACFCWGLENNCTRKISSKDPLQIVLLKGIFSGLGSVVIGLCAGERITVIWSIFAVLGVGFVAYGLSIFCYVYAQRKLGAARTSAYYAVSPFIAVMFSFILFPTPPHPIFFVALLLMIIGAWLCANDEPIFKRRTHRLGDEL